MGKGNGDMAGARMVTGFSSVRRAAGGAQDLRQLCKLRCPGAQLPKGSYGGLDRAQGVMDKAQLGMAFIAGGQLVQHLGT